LSTKRPPTHYITKPAEYTSLSSVKVSGEHLGNPQPSDHPINLEPSVFDPFFFAISAWSDSIKSWLFASRVPSSLTNNLGLQVAPKHI
jgi:hypothetical protein